MAPRVAPPVMGRPVGAVLALPFWIHVEHYFKNASTQYGLSSPLWDFVLRTYRRPTPTTPVETECLAVGAETG